MRYLVLNAQIIWIMKSEYSITTPFFWKYFEFYKPIITFIFIGLDIFMVDRYKKLRKGKYWYVFIVLYVYIFLDKKLIDLFGKPRCQ